MPEPMSEPMSEQESSSPAADWFPLEVELKQDPRGARRDALVARLRERAAEVKRRMDQGLPPEGFSAMQRLQAGLDAAVRVVELVWARHHGYPGRPGGA